MGRYLPLPPHYVTADTVYMSLTVYVSLPGGVVEAVDVPRPTWTIGDVLREACSAGGYSSEVLVAMFEGAVLDCGVTVGEVGLPDGCEVATRLNALEEAKHVLRARGVPMTDVNFVVLLNRYVVDKDWEVVGCLLTLVEHGTARCPYIAKDIVSDGCTEALSALAACPRLKADAMSHGGLFYSSNQTPEKLERFLDILSPVPRDYHCLYSALGASNEYLSAVLAAGWDVNTVLQPGDGCQQYSESKPDSNVRPTLFMAYLSVFSSPEKLRLLLGEKPDVNAKDTNGRTVLMYAAKGRLHDVVPELVGMGADVASVDKRGWTVLHYWARYSSDAAPDCLRELRNVKNKAGRTAVFIAVKSPHELKEVLVEGDHALRDGDGNTLLTYACMGSALSIRKVLLHAKHTMSLSSFVKYVNHKNYHHMDAARILAGRYHPETALLIKNGASYRPPANPPRRKRSRRRQLTRWFH